MIISIKALRDPKIFLFLGILSCPFSKKSQIAETTQVVYARTKHNNGGGKNSCKGIESPILTLYTLGFSHMMKNRRSIPPLRMIIINPNHGGEEEKENLRLFFHSIIKNVELGGEMVPFPLDAVFSFFKKKKKIEKEQEQ